MEKRLSDGSQHIMQLDFEASRSKQASSGEKQAALDNESDDDSDDRILLFELYDERCW